MHEVIYITGAKVYAILRRRACICAAHKGYLWLFLGNTADYESEVIIIAALAVLVYKYLPYVLSRADVCVLIWLKVLPCERVAVLGQL